MLLPHQHRIKPPDPAGTAECYEKDSKQDSAIPLVDEGPRDDAVYDVFTKANTWGVITTIFTVNKAVVHFAENVDASLVVVGDKKTNHTEWAAFQESHSNVVYLSPDAQTKLQFKTAKALPWNHFGRKSIGYLFAVSRGAMYIFDFDDDNILNIKSFNELQEMEVHDVSTSHHIYNPYAFFEPTNQEPSKAAIIWPRGQSLQFNNDPETYDVPHPKSAISLRDLVVVQSLADHDPDVDAIYRMTRKLPVLFEKKGAIVVPPASTFVPWNAQGVLIRKEAVFGLLLPVTVPGRVSDIWRSYIASRLLWETGLSVGYSSAVVTQYRNPHSYQQDLVEEHDLYYKCDDLLGILANWTSSGFATLDGAYLDLMTVLVQHKILGELDLEMAKHWVADLGEIGYAWPVIQQRMPAFTPQLAPVVDQRGMMDEAVAGASKTTAPAPPAVDQRNTKEPKNTHTEPATPLEVPPLPDPKLPPKAFAEAMAQQRLERAAALSRIPPHPPVRVPRDGKWPKATASLAPGERKKKITIWHDQFFGNAKNVPYAETMDACKSDCFVTMDRKYIDKADAIIHHCRTSSLPPEQYKDKPWIMHCRENPAYTPQLADDSIMAKFSYTTYARLDSDFPFPSWKGENMPGSTGGRGPSTVTPVVPFAERKDVPIYAVNSNCESVRTAYQKQLMKFVDIDSYGKCLHNKNGLTPIYQKDFHKANAKLQYSYKFTLVFMNADCTEWVDTRYSSCHSAVTLLRHYI